ncbi:MAG: PAS domain S-box protein, partial [Candidatus Marinimicrobia bacterium]|nr:PAS domain S-box protein [Candidatus Neomarinimicrobiota bacterium]
MSNNMFKLSKQAMIKIGILSLTLSIFILDLQIPLGVAIGELYSIIILLTIFVKNKKSTVVLSTVLTIIIILGYYLSPEGGELWKIIFNRIFSILLIWIIGGVILKRKSLEFSNDTLLKTLHDERNMFLGGPVVIFKWQNKEGWPIEYVSKNVETILGYTDKEFLNENLNYADLIVKKYQSIVMQEVSDAISMKTENFTHTPYEIKKKNGETLYISDHTTLLYDENGTITHFLGFIIDVTKDIQNELLMAENELKFRTLADYTSDWEYWLKPDGHFKYVSPSCMNISGYSKDEFMANAQLFFSIIHPDFKESVSEHHKYRQNEEEDEDEDEHYSSMEFIIISKDGKNKWIEHACVPIYSEEGEYLGRRGTNRDITNRKTYEAELKKFNTLVEQSPFSIVMTDLKGKIEYVNPHFEGVTGYSYQKALGENVRILKSGNTDPKIYQQLWEELNKGNTWKGEFENKDINGNSYWESVSIT